MRYYFSTSLKLSLPAEETPTLFWPLPLQRIATVQLILMMGFLSRKCWSYTAGGSWGYLKIFTTTDRNETLSSFNCCINSNIILIESSLNLIEQNLCKLDQGVSCCGRTLPPQNPWERSARLSALPVLLHKCWQLKAFLTVCKTVFRFFISF